MPYKSEKQKGYFHANEEKIGKKTVEEFDKASKGLKLPAEAPKRPKK